MVVYRSHNEVLVCKKEDEKHLIEEYFTKAMRDLEDYDRTETSAGKYAISIVPGSMDVSVE